MHYLLFNVPPVISPETSGWPNMLMLARTFEQVFVLVVKVMIQYLNMTTSVFPLALPSGAGDVVFLYRRIEEKKIPGGTDEVQHLNHLCKILQL